MKVGRRESSGETGVEVGKESQGERSFSLQSFTKCEKEGVKLPGQTRKQPKEMAVCEQKKHPAVMQRVKGNVRFFFTILIQLWEEVNGTTAFKPENIGRRGDRERESEGADSPVLRDGEKPGKRQSKHSVQRVKPQFHAVGGLWWWSAIYNLSNYAKEKNWM